MRNLPLQWIWAVVPILPFIVGFFLLNILNDDTAELKAGFLEIAVALEEKSAADVDLPAEPEVSDNQEYSAKKEPTESERAAPLFDTVGLKVTFLNQFFIYVSVGLFHLAGCVAVFAYMAHRTWVSPGRAQIVGIFVVSMVILGVANWAARQVWFDGALHLAYRNLCDILVLADSAPQILPGSCSEKGISKFAWLAAFPYIFGLLAAASASAVVSGLIRGSEADAKARYDQVTVCFQATAFVLVTSILALKLFYELPLVIVDNDKAATLITGYAHGFTMYWGVLFTITLVAIFAPANLILRAQIQSSEGTPELGGAKMFLDERTRNMVKTGLTTLAPLIVGSAGSFFETFANALGGG